MGKIFEKEEIDYILQERNKGVTIREISKVLGRSLASVKSKCIEIQKKSGTFGTKHRNEKYQENWNYLKENFTTTPSVLDAYAGEISWWETMLGPGNVVTNDTNKSYSTTYHLPAQTLMKELVKEEKTYDIVDLDPFNSPYKCFDNAMKIAKKGLIMTFGDKLGLICNLKLATCRYGCQKYVEDDIIAFYILRARKLHRKKLILVGFEKWRMLWRAWFIIEDIPGEITIRYPQNLISVK